MASSPRYSSSSTSPVAPFFIPRERLALRVGLGRSGWTEEVAERLTRFAPFVGEVLVDLHRDDEEEEVAVRGEWTQERLQSTLQALHEVSGGAHTFGGGRTPQPRPLVDAHSGPPSLCAWLCGV
jgi:hypothetical protein